MLFPMKQHSPERACATAQNRSAASRYRRTVSDSLRSVSGSHQSVSGSPESRSIWKARIHSENGSENPLPDHSLHNPRIERDLAKKKKRIIRWGMMRQIQKNGRPGRTESARLFLRGETVHPIIFSDFFRVSKHRPLKLYQHKRRIKPRFLSINVVRTWFLFFDLRANHRK